VLSFQRLFRSPCYYFKRTSESNLTGTDSSASDDLSTDLEDEHLNPGRSRSLTTRNDCDSIHLTCEVTGHSDDVGHSDEVTESETTESQTDSATVQDDASSMAWLCIISPKIFISNASRGLLLRETEQRLRGLKQLSQYTGRWFTGVVWYHLYPEQRLCPL